MLGSRLSEEEPRGFFSPVEARVHLGLDYEDLFVEERRMLDDRSKRRRFGMMARAVLARLIGGNVQDPKAASIFGIEPACLTAAQALDYLFAPVEENNRIVHFAHPHALNVALVDHILWQQLNEADAVLADGVGVRIATRMLGGSLPHNLNGTDMFPRLCARASQEQRPIVMIGGKQEVVEECARRTRATHPELSIPVVSHGYLSDEESRALVEELRSLDRPIVLVGMGTPIQEQWVWTYLSQLEGVVVLTVGGLFDFYSGTMPRAPLAMRELGLEWLYRLSREPRRMFRRYLFGNPLFLLMTGLQRLGLRPRSIARLPGTAKALGVRRRFVPRRRGIRGELKH
jgi:N-acetylglucosaminyldiphosphoundecaprenol N-acetyl-beta-D-mannosaminyltransferase